MTDLLVERPYDDPRMADVARYDVVERHRRYGTIIAISAGWLAFTVDGEQLPGRPAKNLATAERRILRYAESREW